VVKKLKVEPKKIILKLVKRQEIPVEVTGFLKKVFLGCVF
jgi:hypothetical protein